MNNFSVMNFMHAPGKPFAIHTFSQVMILTMKLIQLVFIQYSNVIKLGQLVIFVQEGAEYNHKPECQVVQLLEAIMGSGFIILSFMNVSAVVHQN